MPAMPKKSKPDSDDASVVDPQLLEAAWDYVFEAKPVKRFPCRICNEPGATDGSDGLCWVCRRLKISAWREAEALEQDAVGD